MSNESSGQEDDASAASTRALEVATALFFLVIGCLVMWDSQRQGAGWGDDGPQSGYFPFYIGLLMSAATLVNLCKALRYGHPTSCVSKGKIKRVRAIFVPCLVYVGALQVGGL